MRSVERRFREVEKACPGHSSLIVFGRTIKGQGFSRRMVAFYFTKLVDKGDYPSGGKKQLTRFYYEMTKAEHGQKQGQIAHYSDSYGKHALCHA